MDSEIDIPPSSAESGSAGFHGDVLPAGRAPRRAWWALTLLAVLASVLIGAWVQHAIDRRNAARDLYRMQVLTTISRFNDAEGSQIALPVSRRSASAFGDLANSVSDDSGVNGLGTLRVSLGSGSAAPPNQIAFSVTVASPYASSTFAVWYLSSGDGSGSDIGACVLSSTLLGAGRATAFLNLGGGPNWSVGVQPCSRRWWSANSSGLMQPRLDLAGIPQ